MIKRKRRINKIETICGIRVDRCSEASAFHDGPGYKFIQVTDLLTGKRYGFSSWYSLYATRKAGYEDVKAFAKRVHDGDYGEHYNKNFRIHR